MEENRKAMELEAIPLEKKTNGDDEGPSKPMLEGKIQEEEQPDHYAKLEAPAEDIYAQAHFPGKAGKQTEGNARLYRAGCLFLTLICLILLLAVIVLSVKLQAAFISCPGRGTSSVATCKYEQCLADFSIIQPKSIACKLCADGWLEFEGSCFYLSTTRLNWDQSQRNCSAQGGAMAVISSQKFQSFLTAKGEKRGYWIGLRRNETQWSWVNHTPLKESYWLDNENRGDCGYLKTSKPHQKNWMKWPCTSTTYFICEMQLQFYVQA